MQLMSGSGFGLLAIPFGFAAIVVFIMLLFLTVGS